MTIIIGLGNPGKKFEQTRHNVGFQAIENFSKQNSFVEFALDKKSNSLISENNNILLVKPQTFMNESGKAVAEIIKNKNTKNIIVIHDDIDLPVGKIRIVKERGSAGHKGVESIIKSIGNNGLIRIRIGIEPFSTTQSKPEAKAIVLEKFSKQEQEFITKAIQETSKAIDAFLKEGLEKAMNEFNK
jgi:PTH1 family peptidyl-tRNA hydrolase